MRELPKHLRLRAMSERRSLVRAAAALALGTVGSVALVACGSNRASVVTETVTVTTGSSQPATAPPTTTTQTTTNPAHTRTAPAPAFTGGGAGGGGTGGTPAAPMQISDAVARVRALGYAPLGSASYRSDETLRVLVGIHGSDQRAFFFDRTHYLGTDASAPSGHIGVVSQADTAITLSYGIYAAGDATCCPSAGSRDVHFVLDMGRLGALDPIPSISLRR